MLQIIFGLFSFSVNVSITSLILFVLSTVGLTSLIVESAVFEPLRKFFKNILPTKMYKVFECFQCMGFWSGVLCGLIFIHHNLFVIIACGWAGSFLSPFLEKLVNYFDALAFLAVIQKDDNE